MSNANPSRTAYLPDYTGTQLSGIYPSPLDRNKRFDRSSTNRSSQLTLNEIRTDFNPMRSIPRVRGGSSAPTGSCMSTKLILVTAVLAIALIAATAVPLLVILLQKTSATSTLFPNTTSTTATTTSATTSTTTTTNLCLSNALRWNTTGVTFVSGSQYSGISGLYFDANDTVYFVDEGPNCVVWKLPKNAANGTLIAGIYQVRSGSSTGLNYPQDVYWDSQQNLYVTDYYNARVQKYTNGSAIGVTIAGTSGTAGTALNQFGGLRYFWFDSTETFMYVTDCDNHRIMRYPTNGTGGSNGVLAAGGNGAGNTATTLNYPWGIYSLPSLSNDLYISNYAGHSVMRWTPGASSGTFVAGTPGVAGSNATLLNLPMGVKLDSNLNLYVVDYANHRVQMFCYNSPVGVTVAGTGTAGNSATQLNSPRGIAFDSAMNMYISDTGNRRIQKFAKL